MSGHLVYWLTLAVTTTISALSPIVVVPMTTFSRGRTETGVSKPTDWYWIEPPPRSMGTRIELEVVDVDRRLLG